MCRTLIHMSFFFLFLQKLHRKFKPFHFFSTTRITLIHQRIYFYVNLRLIRFGLGEVTFILSK